MRGDSKKAAGEVKRKLEARLTLGDEKPQVATFWEYAQTWLEQYVSASCKRSSQRVLRGIVNNHLIPEKRSLAELEMRPFTSEELAH